jgi:serine/threonine protein kinase
VAVKLLRVQSLPDAKVTAAFEKEMLLLSKLKHKNVTQVFGVCMQPGKLSVVTEYVRLGGVDACVRADTPLANRLAMQLKLKIALDAAEGLGELTAVSVARM